MLNLYAVSVWHPSAPRYGKIINISSFTIGRAQFWLRKATPGCMAAAQPRVDLAGFSPGPPGYFRRPTRA